MKRRDFFTKLGIGLASTAVAAKLPAEAKTPPQATLRPKCRKCSIPMLVRYDRDRGTYAFCGNTECKRYGKEVRLKLME